MRKKKQTNHPTRKSVFLNGYKNPNPPKRDYAEPYRVFLPANSRFQISIPGC